MVIKPRLKGGLALTNHPIGAKEFVKRQIDYVKSQDKYTGPKKSFNYRIVFRIRTFNKNFISFWCRN